jgi:hypothetical protein
MKKTIKFLGIAAILAAMVISMTGCTDSGDNSHKHDYSGAWQKDATHHWKVCPTANEIGQKPAHSPLDGICSTCGYDSHTHNFSGAWKYDETHHWKECADDGEIGQKANHVYSFIDICTICSYADPKYETWIWTTKTVKVSDSAAIYSDTDGNHGFKIGTGSSKSAVSNTNAATQTQYPSGFEWRGTITAATGAYATNVGTTGFIGLFFDKDDPTKAMSYSTGNSPSPANIFTKQ